MNIQNPLHIRLSKLCWLCQVLCLRIDSTYTNWRASVASETLTGETQLKIGDVCLLASERSERDSIRGG